MVTIGDLIRRFEAIDVNVIATKTIESSLDYMADLNALQINSGLKSDGEFMPDYSLRSVIQYNKPVGPIRLRDKGDWQAGLYAKLDGNKIVFKSSDTKDAELVERYGTEIEGLSEKYRFEALGEKIRPEFKREIESATLLKMR